MIVTKPTTEEYRQGWDNVFKRVRYNVWYENGESETRTFFNEHDAKLWAEYHKVVRYVKLC